MSGLFCAAMRRMVRALVQGLVGIALPALAQTGPSRRSEAPLQVCSAGGSISGLLCTTPQALRSGLSHDAALALALERSAMLQARAAATAGAAAAEASAAQLPDPRLSLGLDNLPVTSADRYSLTRDFMTQRQIGWTQDVPNAAKRQARAEGAAARTARERAQLGAERVVVQREASLAWLARFFAEQRLAALVALDAENGLLRSTVTARMAGGKATAAEVLATQQETLALADRRDELTRDIAKARAALRRWVGDAADAPLLGGAPDVIEHGAVQTARLDTHPELAAYAPMTDMARADAHELEAAKQGDWAWSVGYAKRGPAYSDMVSLQISIELPLWSRQRQDPQIEARRKEIDRLAAEREDTRRRIVGEIEALQADAAELDARIARLAHQALPLAEQRAALALASYQAGRAELPDVIAARREVIETRLRLIDLRASQAQVLTQLDSHFTKEQP